MTHQFQTSQTRRTGFTMIEILVVSTIMIVLTAVGLVSYTQVNQNARNGKRKADLETVRQALVLYRTDNGSYPNVQTYAAAIAALQVAPAYLDAQNIADPKGVAPYVYTYTSAGAGATFSLCAALEPSAAAHCLRNP